MFTFVTAFDWCNGGYDLFDGSQNGCSCHRAETLDSNIADTASGPAQVCQLQRQGLAILRPRGGKLRQGKLHGFTQEYFWGWSENLDIYYSSFRQGGHLVAASCTDIVRNVTAHSITTG
jgi:hypothetical protein